METATAAAARHVPCMHMYAAAAPAAFFHCLTYIFVHRPPRQSLHPCSPCMAHMGRCAIRSAAGCMHARLPLAAPKKKHVSTFANISPAPHDAWRRRLWRCMERSSGHGRLGMDGMAERQPLVSAVQRDAPSRNGKPRFCCLWLPASAHHTYSLLHAYHIISYHHII